ncbi:hypothetical protein [Reyranella sp.]|uniref:hypothetical protein n=1 Tax=Reyranella sp. TaxID=1929291 RepID=UPI003F6F6883
MTSAVPEKAGETSAVPSREVKRLLPVRWGSDPLSAFWEAASGNTVANFVHASPELQLLHRVDALLARAAENLIEPKNWLVALLLLRTHSAYRAATLVATAGMPTDTYPILRTILETAGYALLIHRDSKLAEVWLRRDEGAKEKQAVRNTFTPRAIKGALQQIDPGLLQVFDSLYEYCIDFGAHPNEKALTANLSMSEVGKTKHYKVQYLHGNTTFVVGGMKNLARAGLFALFAFQHTMTARFQILGLKDHMNALRGQL